MDTDGDGVGTMDGDDDNDGVIDADDASPLDPFNDTDGDGLGIMLMHFLSIIPRQQIQMVTELVIILI